RPAGSFRRVLKNRSFLLLWLAQLLSQIVFNAANYGIIAIVTAITHSTVMVGIAIVTFTLPAVPFSLLAGVYVDYLLAPAGLGLVLGGLITPALAQRLGKSRTIAIGSLCTAACLILIPL